MHFSLVYKEFELEFPANEMFCKKMSFRENKWSKNKAKFPENVKILRKYFRKMLKFMKYLMSPKRS